jgi:hypothetical protein
VHFRVEHDFAAPREQVAAVLCDETFHTHLDLPDLSRPEVVSSSVSGTTRLLRLRYTYVGQLDPIARKIVGGRKLTWIQELQLDTATYTGTLTFAAEADADRLYGEATVTMTTSDGPSLEGARTKRVVSGDLHVRVPLVGSTAERRIVPGLLRRLDAEADAVSNVLSG